MTTASAAMPPAAAPVITVRPKRYHSAPRRPLPRLGATPVSADELIVGAPAPPPPTPSASRWNEAIIATDAAGPDGDQWSRLLRGRPHASRRSAPPSSKALSTSRSTDPALPGCYGAGRTPR